MTGRASAQRAVGAYYQSSAVEGASQGQLIVMLFDGSIRFLRQAIDALERRDLEGACEAMLRAKAIVAHLLDSLRTDANPELAGHLRKLYLFCYQEIVAANLEKSPARLQPVIRVMSSLREAWHQVALQEKTAGPSSSPGPASDSLYLSITT